MALRPPTGPLRQIPDAGAPPATNTEEADTPRPIGGFVSPDVVRQPAGNERGSRPEQFGRVPRTENDLIYMTGDEYRPARLSPNGIQELQGMLVDAGLLTGRFQVGVWDERSVGAYRDLLGMSNQSGVPWQQMLSNIRSAQDQFGRSGGRAALQIRVSNPDDLRAAFRQVVYQRLGGQFLADDQIDSMVTAFQDKEREIQRAAYGGTAELTDMPSLETFADQQIRAADAGGEQATKMAGYADVLMQMLGGG